MLDSKQGTFDTFDIKKEHNKYMYFYLHKYEGLPSGLPVLDDRGRGLCMTIFATVPHLDGCLGPLGSFPLLLLFHGVWPLSLP